jgi:Uma2 family endonuclease
MTDLQEKTHKKFTDNLSEGLPVYWWYDYEHAVFRSYFEGNSIQSFVKCAWNEGTDF